MAVVRSLLWPYLQKSLGCSCLQLAVMSPARKKIPPKTIAMAGKRFAKKHLYFLKLCMSGIV